MRIVLLGPPGAGKGSLASLVKEGIGIEHLSSGDMLRDEMKKGSSLGLEIKSLIEKGSLVPDETITKLVELKVTGDLQNSKGYFLDGFPRTVQQAKDLDKILVSISQSIDFVLCMEASLDVILFRLAGRRVCRKCGAVYHVKNKPSQVANVCDICSGELYQRSDDNDETIRKRMQVYELSTKPIIDYYVSQGKLKKIDGNKETTDLRDELQKILNEDKSYQNQKTR
jgi:adenylate kinase